MSTTTRHLSETTNIDGWNMRAHARIRVLIAHADPLIAAGLAASLREHGFDVLGLDSEAAFKHPNAHAVAGADVAVADYDSGLGLLGSRGRRHDRVMILTHRDGEAEICHALEQGAVGYLLHGCSVTEILHGIRLMSDGGIVLGPLVASRVAESIKQREPLTSRELDILRRMMFGLSNKSMARALGLAVGTVKTHVKSVLRKLGVANRTHAVAVAQRRGILPRESAAPPRVVRLGGIGNGKPASPASGQSQLVNSMRNGRTSESKFDPVGNR
jgi:DNA-binding NarL/FixJ family response regulator